MIQIEKIQVNPLILRIRVQTTLNQDGQDSWFYPDHLFLSRLLHQ
jgi:hypothetical protein